MAGRVRIGAGIRIFRDKSASFVVTFLGRRGAAGFVVLVTSLHPPRGSIAGDTSRLARCSRIVLILLAKAERSDRPRLANFLMMLGQSIAGSVDHGISRSRNRGILLQQASLTLRPTGDVCVILAHAASGVLEFSGLT